MVPATVIVPLLKNKINEKKAEATGFLIDGFPREVAQAELFEGEIGLPAHILFCDCSQETMKARLMKRGETSGRVDDNEEVTSISTSFILAYRIDYQEEIRDLHQPICSCR